MGIVKKQRGGPLVRAKVVMSALMMLSPIAQALTTVDGDLTIDANTPLDNYQLNPGARLDANGASTQHIDIFGGAHLEMSGSTVDAQLDDGIALRGGSSANVTANSRVVSARYGLRLQHDNSLGGSTATVSDSYVEGARGGALISDESTLVLHNSTLVGTGTAAAADMFDNATLSAEGSRLQGARNGLRILSAQAQPGTATVSLVGSHVEGQDGSAIVVGNPALGPAEADILVAGGSTLQGSNGTLLEVMGSSTARMTVDNSQLVGDVRVEEGSSASLTLDNHASLTGRLENVAGLTLSNQARWNMVEDSKVGSLALEGGSVRFGEPGQYQRLSVGTLAGSGNFIMDADFSTGDSDYLEITGTATGSHTLLVGSSGADPVAENQLHLVHAAAGDAQFSLLNGPVDVGTFSYELVQRGNDWFLDGASKVISPGTASVLALFNTAPTVWYGELTTLRSRMGELRLDQGKAGGWVRAYGNKYNVSDAAGSAYQQVQQGFSLGADMPLPLGDGQWLLGVMAGHSNSDLNLTRGASADVKSYYLGLYATWLDAQSGYYLDGVVKLNRFDNSSDITMSDGKRSKGDYDNFGVGASLEFGRHLELGNDYFIEPYTQWSMVTIQGKHYDLDNGMQARGDVTRSLLGKAGATVGRTFDLGAGRKVQPYLRAAYAHEFVDDNQVNVNDNRFDNDLSGSRGELGLGVAVSMTDRLQLHADFDYANGEKIEQPWGANVGLHYSW
ncbi:autotransporter outer membrane beta-barrel domain-containing protein [Pseudomonas putida]|uniref:Outer membrane autotransporter barrel domain protein n=1 Tax=Pseudomonas putida (strain ATCC 700007 / DSM 6899 / JCM 31910 / BCRC 17059 / LMG 24140 / F1) TaxID=351746 RepID=A5W741_PSEP1|nr:MULTISPECIES: autotransporter outer membrane beta-barrel domain-containing protein [Pseudomonas]MDD2001022.1 autotransporter outer membrane beta-barrel domain-containing protein [Pseudomonas putida]POA82864.1 autotransporter outer membrane beta-barrel domain-containing protein [Pseudomonas sp. FW305-E2]HDS1790782.1 pertactin family autotransporter [Pseudomonas putida]HEN8734281.1 pertactin family autotransporter [Pseudomonas putida]